ETLSFTLSELLVDLGIFASGHWVRITRYVRALAGAVREEGEYVRLKDDAYLDPLAAFMPVYDTGLLGVPRSVLMKPGRLDADELSVMQTHPTQGSDLLGKVAARFGVEVPGLTMAAEIIRNHHERWDGSGYPDSLSGSEIPLPARVAAIVTVYEA